MTKLYEFLNQNLMNFNQYKLFNVLKMRKIIRIRIHLFVQMVVTHIGIIYHQKKIQVHIFCFRLVFHFKFLNYAIQISSGVAANYLTVTKSNFVACVIFQLTSFSNLVNGTQMVFMKLFSNAPSVGADQKERLISMIFMLLSKMVQERFLMSQTRYLKTTSISPNRNL